MQDAVGCAAVLRLSVAWGALQTDRTVNAGQAVRYWGVGLVAGHAVPSFPQVVACRALLACPSYSTDLTKWRTLQTLICGPVVVKALHTHQACIVGAGEAAWLNAGVAHLAYLLIIIQDKPDCAHPAHRLVAAISAFLLAARQSRRATGARVG